MDEEEDKARLLEGGGGRRRGDPAGGRVAHISRPRERASELVVEDSPGILVATGARPVARPRGVQPCRELSHGRADFDLI